MTDQPTVSIITPAFNRASYIGATIDSVLAQSYSDFEHIIVDDGSTDDTAKEVARYTDPRLRLIRQANQGQAVARNYALQLSRGQYVCFLDSDDLWSTHTLARQLQAFADHPDVGLVHGDRIRVDANGNEIDRRNMTRRSGWVTEALLKDNFISLATTMVRADLVASVNGFTSSYRVAPDYDLWLRLSVLAPFLYVPEFLAYYRITDDQISNDKTGRVQANERQILAFLNNFNHGLTRSQIRTGLGGFYARKARTEATAGLARRAYLSLFRAIRHRPFKLGPWRSGARITLDLVRRPWY